MKIMIFKGENHDFWTIKMESFFTSLDVLEFVKQDYENQSMQQNVQQHKVKHQREKKIIVVGVFGMIKRRVINTFFKEL